jgi:hypothetical protein
LSGLKGDFSIITGPEIVTYLLRESGHLERDSVNPADIIRLLKLDYVRLNFNVEFGQENFPRGTTPRVLLSFPNKVIATDGELNKAREKFSIFHEIGHYVLPSHHYSLYICDPSDSDGSGNQTWKLEAEASEFAAELLFMGNRFVAEANSVSLSARTVKDLAAKYEASFEATARRLVEKRIRPCMLVVFKKGTADVGSVSGFEPHWMVHYCVSNSSFRNAYFESLKGELSRKLATQIAISGKDIADSITQEISISSPTGQSYRFVSEYFYNQYNIFGFLSEPT